MAMRMVTASILLLVLVGCTSVKEIIDETHQDDWKNARAEARRYLKVLTGDRFETVVMQEDLEPLFDRDASYQEVAEAARRAIRWRIGVAGGQVESGAVNLAMILSPLLAKRVQVVDE